VTLYCVEGSGVRLVPVEEIALGGCRWFEEVPPFAEVGLGDVRAALVCLAMADAGEWMLGGVWRLRLGSSRCGSGPGLPLSRRASGSRVFL
jgi:hypothetical protein